MMAGPVTESTLPAEQETSANANPETSGRDTATECRRVELGAIFAHSITFSEAVDEIVKRAKQRHGGYVVTPNVDHVVLAEKHAALRQAYENASLSLVDGMPLVWLAKVAGNTFPEKISGSDLVKPLMARCAQENLRVYFLGGAPGVGAKAKEVLLQNYPQLNIVGIDSPPLGFEKSQETRTATLQKIKQADPHIVLFALGCPKQELLMAQWKNELNRSMSLGIGATLDFISGNVKRAPQWMSKMGAEWLFRLGQDPKRMAKRYLVRDLAFIPIGLRTIKKSRLKASAH